MCVCVNRVEVSDGVENVDMSLEELQQLLLRSHQQGAVEAGASAVMDVSAHSRKLNENLNNSAEGEAEWLMCGSSTCTCCRASAATLPV